jgi:hypothetical protein
MPFLLVAAACRSSSLSPAWGHTFAAVKLISVVTQRLNCHFRDILVSIGHFLRLCVLQYITQELPYLRRLKVQWNSDFRGFLRSEYDWLVFLYADWLGFLAYMTSWYQPPESIGGVVDSLSSPKVVRLWHVIYQGYYICCFYNIVRHRTMIWQNKIKKSDRYSDSELFVIKSQR